MYPFLSPTRAMVHCGRLVVGQDAMIGGGVVYPGWCSWLVLRLVLRLVHILAILRLI